MDCMLYCLFHCRKYLQPSYECLKNNYASILCRQKIQNGYLMFPQPKWNQHLSIPLDN